MIQSVKVSSMGHHKVVTIKHRKAWFHRLLNVEPRVEKYIGSGTVWYVYGLAQRVGTCGEYRIVKLLEERGLW